MQQNNSFLTICAFTGNTLSVIKLLFLLDLNDNIFLLQQNIPAKIAFRLL